LRFAAGQQLAFGFKVTFSCVDTRWLAAGWVGRELDDTAIADLRGVRDRNGLDLGGEEGEDHTLVTDRPSFARPIRIRSHSQRTRELLAYMEIHELELAAL
jgi:diphthamide synthase (EF-2-diphthine--ammonia ligase)